MKQKSKLLMVAGCVVGFCVVGGILYKSATTLKVHNKEIKSELAFSMEADERIVECVAKEDFTDKVYSVEDDTMYKIPDPPEFTKGQTVIIRVNKDNVVTGIDDDCQ